MRLIVGITGSTGVIYGVRMLEVLKEKNVETHLLMTEWATKCLTMETEHKPEYVKSLPRPILMIITWLQVFLAALTKQME